MRDKKSKRETITDQSAQHPQKVLMKLNFHFPIMKEIIIKSLNYKKAEA